MFFVHHNQRQIGQRSKYSKPRANDELGLPEHGAQVVLAALAGGGLAVQHGGGQAGEAVGHALQQLRREVDFGQQQQHLPALRERACHRVKIDFGFAAACDAVEQKGLELPEGSLNLARRGLLLGVERVGGWGDIRLPLRGDCKPILRGVFVNQAGGLGVDFFQRGQREAA